MSAEFPAPPPTERIDHYEVLHGHRLNDPYRWLEQDDASTAAWLDVQRGYADQVFAGLRHREHFQSAMDAELSKQRTGVPKACGSGWLVQRNSGELDQDQWFFLDQLDQLHEGGRLLVDPNLWSPDGSVALEAMWPSPDGELIAMSVSQAGSDWQHIRVLRTADATELDEPEVLAKFSGAAWLPDSSGFCYNAYPEADETTDALPGAHLMLHRLGDSADVELLSFPDDPQLAPWALMTRDPLSDQQWLVVHIVRGTETANDLWVYPVQGASIEPVPIKLITGSSSGWRYLGCRDQQLYLLTDAQAPSGRVARIDLRDPDAEPRTLLGEQSGILQDGVLAGKQLVLEMLQDAQPRLFSCSLDGSLLCDLAVPGGAVVELSAEPDRDELVVGMSTLCQPTQVYRVDAATRQVDQVGRASSADPVHTLRRVATSADGTAVPYFLIGGSALDANPAPTILYGYGGFSVATLADYRPGWGAWLDAGGRLAIANLRGGGEYGTPWYESGKRAHRQNVYDDFIAVAEHLIDTGVTSAEQLAVHGRSNGGLLVGAVLSQRPELFAAAIPMVGVLDMLRFHRFTIGAAWISDYGDPEVAEDFQTLLSYSPLHNLHEGTAYPATLICTGDHDDRVVPAHSYKFAAELQRVQAGPDPIVLRVAQQTGHGAGKPNSALGAEWAELLSFAAHFTGLKLER